MASKSKGKPSGRSTSFRSSSTSKKQSTTNPTSPTGKASDTGGMQQHVPFADAMSYNNNGRSPLYPAVNPQPAAVSQRYDYGYSGDSLAAATSRTAIIPVSTLVWAYLDKFHRGELVQACGGYLPVTILNSSLSESEQVVIDRRQVGNVRVNEVQTLARQYAVVHQTIDLKPFQAKPDAMTVISALVEREYSVLFTRYSNNNNAMVRKQ